MATIEHLQAQKQALEKRLNEGDLSAEPALARVDCAIAARKQKIVYSQKRLATVKAAVKAGVPLADTRPEKVAAAAKKRAEQRAKRPVNRF